MRKATSNASRLCGLVAACALWPSPCVAQTVWTGPTITFTKPNGANWNLPENQDRMTDNVWITRANYGGIFNIAQEAYYTGISPIDTEWAYGSAEDYEDLTFAPWVVWNGSYPPGMVGDEAVVHLITDDIYIDITFLSWSCCGAGGFSYVRTTPGECLQVSSEEVVCHADGDTFTYTITGTDSCSGDESSYVFTASGGAVGEEMCFTLVVAGEGGGFCCMAQKCVSIPDCAPAGTIGDIDLDGEVGITDLMWVLGSWGPCSECGTCPADVDGDCDVGITDFMTVIGNWGS